MKSPYVVVAMLAVAGPAVADPYFDVTTYGAVANDNNDDTAAIKAAIAAADSSTAPGTVFFPAGVYDVKCYTDSNNQTVAGTLAVQTRYITIKGAGGRTSQSTILHAPCSGASPLFDLSGTETGSIRIASLALKQSNTNSTQLIKNTSSDGLDIDDVTFEGHAYNSNNLVYSSRSNTRITNSKFSLRNVSAYGVHLQHVGETKAINSVISDNYFINVEDKEASIGRGILIDKASTNSARVEGVTISRNVMISTGQEHIRINAALHVNISNNVIDKIGYAGVWLDATQASVDSVVIANNWFGFRTGNGAEVGVLGSGSDSYVARGVSIANNTFFEGKYGIAAGTGTTRWNISGNTLDGNNITDSTGMLITSNLGVFNVIGNIINQYATKYYATGVSNVSNVANWCGTSSC